MDRGRPYHGQAMCFWVLPRTCLPIARSTVQPASEEELRDSQIQYELKAYDDTIAAMIGDLETDIESPAFEVGSRELLKALEDADDNRYYLPIEPDATKPDADDHDEQMYHNLTLAEVNLPLGDDQNIAKVIGRKRDAGGIPIGK